jgi:predicted DNA-binding ribbon-helix-helix protein
VSLEQEFWDALNEIADASGKPLSRLIDDIDKRQGRGKNLSSALRLFVLAHFRDHRG